MKEPRSRKLLPDVRPPTSPHQSRFSPRRSTISLCVIVRDEEAFVGDCLASARPFVDEIVVLDTGSTDATCEIARTYGARIGTFAWCDDFSAARNAAIDLVTSDWILMLDADERLHADSGPKLREFVQSNPSAALYYAPKIENRESDNPDDDQVSFSNRLFPRLAGLRYSGAVHEDLVYPPDPARASGLRLNFIRITHLGYQPDIMQARGKRERNQRLLLLETVSRPTDPLPWYYLGRHALADDQPVEAAEYFRRSLATHRHRPMWSTVEIYTQLIVVYAQLNQPAHLESIAEEADLAGALSASARHVIAQSLVDRGQYPAAIQQLLRAVEANQPLETVVRPGIGRWLTRLDLARLYEHTGNARAALQQVELALADPEVRDRGDVANTAVRLAVETGDMAALARCLAVVTAADGAFGSLDRAIRRGDWQSAYDAALALSGLTVAETARMLLVASRLQDGGAAQAALNVLVRLHDAQPALPQVHVLLVTVLKDLGRFDDALAANDILQVLLADPTRWAAAA